MWKNLISGSQLKEGVEYLFFDNSWKDNNNPKGIRIGYYYDNGFMFSYWNTDCDAYESLELDTIPDKYFEIPDII